MRSLSESTKLQAFLLIFLLLNRCAEFQGESTREIQLMTDRLMEIGSCEIFNRIYEALRVPFCEVCVHSYAENWYDMSYVILFGTFQITVYDMTSVHITSLPLHGSLVCVFEAFRRICEALRVPSCEVRVDTYVKLQYYVIYIVLSCTFYFAMCFITSVHIMSLVLHSSPVCLLVCLFVCFWCLSQNLRSTPDAFWWGMCVCVNLESYITY